MSMTQSTQRNNAALGMIGGSFVGILALTTPFVFMQLRSSLPYMATPKRKVEKSLNFISQRIISSRANEKKLDTNHNAKELINQKYTNFVDLGSGDGTTILTAASLGWRSTGFELNPTLFFISSLRRFFSSKSIKNNSQLVLGDMFVNRISKDKLQQANCVMIFGVKPLMPQIAELVQRECQPGCFLMSYRFRVPLMNEMNATEKSNSDKDNNVQSNESLLDADLIYDEEEMRIYELNGGCGKK